jgi:hypothetical protein
MRIIGFCVGSLLSIGALLLLYDRADFHRDAGDVDQERIDATIETLRRRWEQQQPPAPSDSTNEPSGAHLASESPMLVDSGAEPTTVSPADNDLPTNHGNVELAQVAAVQPEWHDIWAPFRTQIAAQGFVHRLESVTGLDFRVMKLRSGAYQVAFAYHDHAERDAGLAQIAAATGLDLSSDRP